MRSLHVLPKLIFPGKPMISQCSGTWATWLAAVEENTGVISMAFLVGFIVPFEFILGAEASGLTGTIFFNFA
jgi:hypothetical protein